MSEQWLPVVGYEGFYEVSDMGRVRSLDRATPMKTATGKMTMRRVAGRILKPGTAGRGYPYVNLMREHKRQKTRDVHRLVLEAFVGPKPDGLVTRHLNGDRLDNRLENLAYGTYSENMADNLRHGTHSMLSKTHCIRGHELIPENCYPRGLALGKRDCMLCCKIRNDAITERRRALKELRDGI